MIAGGIERDAKWLDTHNPHKDKADFEKAGDLTGKFVLSAQSVSGLGNIYTDEVLHRAGVRHDRPAGALSRSELRRLADAIVETLREAIVAGGSTLGDAQYVDIAGAGGTFQDRHRVYGREGLSCVTCDRGRIRRATVGGRSTFYCPRCQK